MDGNSLKDLLGRMAGMRLVLPPAASRVLSAWKYAAEAPPGTIVVVQRNDHGLRAVRVTRRRGGALDVSAASRTLPADLDPAERPARERQILTALVAELGAKGLPAVAALEGSDVIVRRLTMPRMSGSDLASALELECRKQINYPLADAVVRHEVLDGASAPRGEVPVVVAIAPRRRVEHWKSLLTAAGLRPWSLTLAAAGVRAEVARRGDPSPHDVIAYLDLGQDSSQIVVLKGNDLRFTRDLAFGISTMATELRHIVVPGVGTVDRTEAEAEGLLRQYGIPMGVEEAQFADGVPLAAVSIMLRPALERLVRELWNSFDYCNEQFLGDAVSRVVLLGAGRRTPHLERYLAGVLKMPVAVADDERGGTRESGESTPSNDDAESGAALASIRRGSLNFLRGGDAGGATAWLAESIPVPAAAAAALILLVSIAAPAEIDTARARARVAAVRAELATFSAQSDAVARFRNARQEEERLRALLTRLTGSQVVWSSALRDLSHRVGPDVRLTLLEVLEPAAPASAGASAPVAPAARSLRITGLMRTPGSSPERVLAALLRSLGASPIFDQVRLEGCERVSTSLSSFTLTARLAEGAGS
jgi:type IV pilus assembly protein PilM